MRTALVWLAFSGQLLAADGLAPTLPLTTAEDHARVLRVLGIPALRPGADGKNPNAPNAANYDEAKANPYPNLPDPLVLENGKTVKKPADWWRLRRPELVESFDTEIYGRQPKNVPGVQWEVVGTTPGRSGEIATVTKQLVGHVDNSSYPQIQVELQATLTLPAETHGRVPVLLELGFVGARPQMLGTAAPPAAPSGKEQVLAKGWGFAVLAPNSVQPDNGQGLTQGIIGLVNKGQPRSVDDWGALRAWGWGASRLLDYLATEPAVDAKRVAIEGHSRYGKAAVVAMAYDERFAMGFISSSGEGGLKLHRRNWGELVENVAAPSEYHWMAENFLKYAGRLHWDDLPVDAHELIALCAPRPVFISAGATKGDGWVDAKGMFLAGVGAGPVYKLLGKKDLGTATFPPIETALLDGDIAFRQHAEGHTPGPNWPYFLQFASRYWPSAGVR